MHAYSKAHLITRKLIIMTYAQQFQFPIQQMWV